MTLFFPRSSKRLQRIGAVLFIQLQIIWQTPLLLTSNAFVVTSPIIAFQPPRTASIATAGGSTIITTITRRRTGAIQNFPPPNCRSSSSRPSISSSTASTQALVTLQALKQYKGESDEAFFQRLTMAASDPVAFEKMVMEQQQQKEEGNNVTSRAGVSSSSSSSSSRARDGKQPRKKDLSQEEIVMINKKKGYQRVEEWDAELRERRNKGELSWEERVQFDGQRHGNQFQQNEILRKNLKGF